MHLKKATRSLLFANHSKHQDRNLIGAVFFRSTILPGKSHNRQEQPYALRAAVKRVLVMRFSCVSRVGCRMGSGIVSDLSSYQITGCKKLCEQSSQQLDESCFCTNTRTTHTRQNNPYRLGAAPAGVVGAEIAAVRTWCGGAMSISNAMPLRFASGVPYGFRDSQRFELVPKIS